MEIVRVGPGSREVWSRLRAELWPEWSAAEIAVNCAVMLTRPDAVNILALEDGDPIGFAEALIRRDAVNGCTRLRSRSSRRSSSARRGIARALFKAAEAWMVD